MKRKVHIIVDKGAALKFDNIKSDDIRLIKYADGTTGVDIYGVLQDLIKSRILHETYYIYISRKHTTQWASVTVTGGLIGISTILVGNEEHEK